ncbi:MAG: hypothetical protein H0T41_04640 [Rhodobacteraceae bacterium]|nr:hypothetical protein [Paracoccaceae bacterium]
MPAALRLDTLKFAKRLTDAGLPREAAEAIVEGSNEADLSELATRADVAEVKTAISDLRANLYSRLWVMGLGIVGLNVALMKLLP